MKQNSANIFLLGMILAFTFLVYSSTLHYDFTNWDDDQHLLNNLDLRSLDFGHLKNIFTHSVLGVYIPLTSLSFALEQHFFGLKPFIYHLDNLLLHLGVIVFVFLISLELGLPRLAAALSALLFGLHPMHVESVVWITERKDVLYAFFYMWAVFEYCRYLRSSKRSSCVLSWVFGLLAMLAKPMALSLPIILLGCEWMIKKRLNLKMLLEKWTYFLYIIPITLITYLQHVRVPGREWQEAILIWLWSFTFYLKKFIFPFPLIPLYPLPSPVSWLCYDYALAVLMVVFIVFILLRYRNNRYLVFAFWIYVGSIFFLLRFDNLKDPSIVADRFMYLPSFGFCLLFGIAFENALKYLKDREIYKLLLVGSLTFLIGILAVRTYLQLRIWEGGKTLWTYVALYNQGNSRIYHNLGEVYLKEGELSTARRYFIKSIALEPGREESYINLGVMEEKEGRLDKAMGYFEKALSVAPHSVAAYNNLGNVSLLGDKLEKAEEYFLAAIKNDSTYLQPRYNLVEIYIKRRDYGKAVMMLSEIKELDPANEVAALKSIAIDLIQGNKEEALILGKKILREKKNPAFLTNLGGIFGQYNFTNIAFAFYQRSMALDPLYKETYIELGKLYGNLEDFTSAIKTWQEGSMLAPDDRRFEELITQGKRFLQEKTGKVQP